MPNLSLEVHGEGEVVLFLHGWGQNKEMMLPLIDELKYKYKCVVVDLPGFGESSFYGDSNLEGYTDTLYSLLKEKNLLPKYIVGHSFGGKIAVQYYLKYKNINGLVIIASPLIKPSRNFSYYYKVLKYKLRKKLNLKISNQGSEDYRNCPLNMKVFFVSVVNTHFDQSIAKIKVPVLLIWGEEDKKVPLRKAKIIKRKIQDSTLCIQKGGHFAYLDNIQLTRLVIQKFMRRLKDD